jgi:hypothetical protein
MDPIISHSRSDLIVKWFFSPTVTSGISSKGSGHYRFLSLLVEARPQDIRFHNIESGAHRLYKSGAFCPVIFNPGTLFPDWLSTLYPE